MSTTTQVNIEALRQLRRVIEAAPEDRLHMREWTELADCGTAHCAAGWAALDPWFQANTSIRLRFKILEDRSVFPAGYSSPTRNLAAIFGLEIDDAKALFALDPPLGLGPHDISRAEVLANIDRLLAGREAERYEAIVALDDDEDEDEDDLDEDDEDQDDEGLDEIDDADEDEEDDFEDIEPFDEDEEG